MVILKVLLKIMFFQRVFCFFRNKTFDYYNKLYELLQCFVYQPFISYNRILVAKGTKKVYWRKQK